MGKALYRVLAELFDNTRTEVVRRVLRDAELDASQVDLNGTALDVWFRVEEEAVRFDAVQRLVRAAEAELGGAHEGLRAALDAMVDDGARLQPWMFDLDRDVQRKAAQRFKAPATALVVVGPRDAGHRYVSLWGRIGYNSRRPPIEVAWPREVAGEATRLRALLLELVEVFELEARRRELNDATSPMLTEASLERGAWPTFLARLQGDLLDVMFPSRRAGVKALAVVRHEAHDPRPEDAGVLDAYMRHVWAPLAARLKAEPAHEARCVLAFEFHCEGAEQHAALMRVAKKHVSGDGPVVVPAIDPLGRVTEDDLIFWINRYNHDGALFRRMRPAHRKALLADGSDAEAVAARILRRTGGNYEEIINLFRDD
jgi:hypothetical protein